MPIQRLTPQALRKLLDGEVRQKATCVIKFYSNTCELCHNFHTDYVNISKDVSFKDLHFFAFNLADHPTIDYELGFEGVPTIAVVSTSPQGLPAVEVCPDPPDPHPLTFLKPHHVKTFIRTQLDTRTTQEIIEEEGAI